MSLVRYQPFKGIYVFTSALVLLFIRLPYWTALATIPAFQPRKSWSLARTLLVWGANAAVDIMFTVALAKTLSPRENEEGFVWIEPVSGDLVKGEIASMAAVNQVEPVKIWGYWFGKSGPDGKWGQPPKEGEKVPYNFHGGAHIRGSASHKDMSVTIPRRVLEHCAGIVDRAFCPDYRLASAAPDPVRNAYPAALIDALSGYNYLINVVGFKPEDVIVAGDSSGGHLAFNFVRYLILLSPAMGWGQTSAAIPGSAIQRNRNSHFVAEVMESGYSARAILGSFPPEDIRTNIWLSPGSLDIPQPDGKYGGLPPTLILAGGAEYTLDGMRTIRDRIAMDNPKEMWRYSEYEDTPHDWLVIASKLFEREQMQTLDEIKQWGGGFVNDRSVGCSCKYE